MKKHVALQVVIGILVCSIIIGASAQRRAARAGAADVDLLIAGGAVVTMNPDRRVFENGFVAIRGEEPRCRYLQLARRREAFFEGGAFGGGRLVERRLKLRQPAFGEGQVVLLGVRQRAGRGAAGTVER